MDSLIRNTSASLYESLNVNCPENDERLFCYPHAKTNIKARILPASPAVLPFFSTLLLPLTSHLFSLGYLSSHLRHD